MAASNVALRLVEGAEPSTVTKIRALSPANYARLRETLARSRCYVLLGLFDLLRPEAQA